MTKIYPQGYFLFIDDGANPIKRIPLKDVRYRVDGTSFEIRDPKAIKLLDRQVLKIAFATIQDKAGAPYADQATFETLLEEELAGFNTGGKVSIGAAIIAPAYTLVKKDARKQPAFSHAVAQVITVDAAVFSKGDVIAPWRDGVGTVEIIAGAGVTLKGVTDSGGKYFIADQNSYIALIAESATVFRITGNLNRL